MAVTEGYKQAEKGSIVSIVTNGLLFVFKISAGIIGHSNAMIADALDTLGDCLTSTGMLIGYKIAKRPADADHPYGHGKAESIIAKLLALFLIGLGIKVGYNSVHVLIAHTMYVPGSIAVVAAIVSIIVKLGLFFYTSRIGRAVSSTAMTLYSWNIAADVFSSICALVGIVGAKLGFPAMDPIAAFILSLLVIRTGLIGFHRAYDELMDGAPDPSVTEGIRDIVLANKSVSSVKDLKIRKMGLEYIIDLTICVNKSLTVEAGHAITDVVREGIMGKVPMAREVFIHVEPYLTKADT